MQMQGSRELIVSQQIAWDALNDPEVLKACIPGCDRVELSGDNQYNIGMALKIGPVSAKFTGVINLLDVEAPRSYRLKFEGQGCGPDASRLLTRISWRSSATRYVSTVEEVSQFQIPQLHRQERHCCHRLLYDRHTVVEAVQAHSEEHQESAAVDRSA